MTGRQEFAAQVTGDLADTLELDARTLQQQRLDWLDGELVSLLTRPKDWALDVTDNSRYMQNYQKHITWPCALMCGAHTAT